MRYKVKFLLCSTTLALSLSLWPLQNAQALIQSSQDNNVSGRVTLAPELENDAVAPAQRSDSVLPSDFMTPPEAKAAPAAEQMGVQKNVSAEQKDSPLLPQSPSDKKNNPLLPKGSSEIKDNPLLPSGTSSAQPSVNKDVDPFADIVPLSEEEKRQFGDNILNQLSENLFSQMSDIEKQSALLSLELRREKIRSEIEAIRNQRKKALAEEEEARAEKERKQREWEAEQEKKKFEMEQEKRKLEIEAEKLRQETLVKAYKEKMLEKEQKWIATMAETYKEIDALNKDREFLISDFTRKLDNLRSIAAQTVNEANSAKVRYDKDISTLKSQISVLKARLAAEQAARKVVNPFAQIAGEAPQQIMLSDIYAIMEIIGKDENLIAKLINKNGDSFLVKKGTVLQTGHVVDEISETYIRGDLDGVKDYLYFAAGGILDAEPPASDVIDGAIDTATSKRAAKGEQKSSNAPNLFSSDIPSLGKGMFIK